jgi:hypothetical protein
MEKLKGKYEIILGFVTLVVSLSAFKDELAKVNLELGWTTISLAEYFLYAVYGFSICLYLYIVEHIVRETKIGIWKVFDYAIWTAFILFVFILLTPILIIINIVALKVYSVVTNKTIQEAAKFFYYFAAILSFSSSIVSFLTSVRFFRYRKKKIQEEISEQEIIELDNATKLFRDGYYSHSVLESFKVFETHLYKKLTEKNFRVPRYNINDIIQLALKQEIINQADLPAIQDLKAMRNIAAHSNTNYTKQQAEFALEFVKKLLLRNENENRS